MILEHPSAPSATPSTTLLGSAHLKNLACRVSAGRRTYILPKQFRCSRESNLTRPTFAGSFNPLDTLLVSPLFVGYQIHLNSLELDVYKLLVDGCKGGCITILKVKNHMQAGKDENLFIARVVSSRDGAPLIPPEYQPCVIYRVFARDDFQVRACNAEERPGSFALLNPSPPGRPPPNLP